MNLTLQSDLHPICYPNNEWSPCPTHYVYFVCSVIRWHLHAQYANQVGGWGAGIVNQTKQV